MTKRRFTPEELRERRYRQYWESLAMRGLATVCPVCGRYTKCKSGFCRQCSKKVMNRAV